MRVVLSGGGTGGHIMPALAVAESLQARLPNPGSLDLLYIGATTGIETRIVPPLGIPFQQVTTEKLRKTFSLSTVRVAFSLLKGYREAQTYLKAFRPDVCIGTGGYVAAATVFAAHRLSIPTFIHEGNVIPGRTNLWLSRIADRIGVTFAETAGFPPHKVTVTGFPIRRSIRLPESVTSAHARASFPRLAPDVLTLFVTGGSQGSKAINRTLMEAVPELLAQKVQVIHHTGLKNFADIEAEAHRRDLSEGYLPLAFLDGTQMAQAYRAADALLCRGGISTLAESLAERLPLLIVPLPTAYADHQTHNARALEKGGAAKLLPESSLTSASLFAEVLALRNSEARHAMREACSHLLRPDAADTIAELVLTLTPRS